MKLNIRLAVIVSALLLFVLLWWTRYEMQLPGAGTNHAIVLDRLTHKVYIVYANHDGWRELGVKKR